MRRITKGDVELALANGDLSKADLMEVINGWSPEKRGPKENLMRQAHVFAAYLLLQQAGRSPADAKTILMAKTEINPTSLRTLLNRAKKNWTALHPFDPDMRIGIYSVSMVYKGNDKRLSKEHFGRVSSFEMRPADWRI